MAAAVQEAVEGLVRAGLRNPFRVNVAVTARDGAASTQKTPSTLHIEYLYADSSDKVGQTLAFLAQRTDQKVIVYFLTCASVDYFALVLPKLPGGDAIPFMALHGHMKQRKVRPRCCAYSATPRARVGQHTLLGAGRLNHASKCLSS